MYLANRAAVWVRMERWEEVVKDCSLVLDVWEYIDRGEERRRERGGGVGGARTAGEVTVVKALTRRAAAYRAMGDPTKARADLARALNMEGGEQGEGKRRAELLHLLRSLTEEEAQRAHDALAVDAAPATLPRLVEALRAEGGAVGDGVVKELRAVIDRDDEARAAFRLQGGLSAALRRLGQQGEDHVGLMALLVAALAHDGSKDAVVQEGGAEVVLSFLHPPLTPVSALAGAALALLTEREGARVKLRSTQPPLLDLVLPLLTSPSTPTSLLIDALNSTTNLAYSTPWKTLIRQRPDLTPALVRLLRTREVEMLASTFSLLVNLSTQAAVSQSAAELRGRIGGCHRPCHHPRLRRW